MATQKIKFKMSIKELSFDFEGDVETGQRIQNEIKKTLTSLAHTQEKLLPHDPNVIDAEAASPAANGKKVRGPRKIRVKSHTPRAQIVALRTEGFFDEKRDIKAIKVALAKKGHNFKTNELSAAFKPLLHKGVLIRDKDEEGGTYQYEKGPNDDVSGTADDAE